MISDCIASPDALRRSYHLNGGCGGRDKLAVCGRIKCDPDGNALGQPDPIESRILGENLTTAGMDLERMPLETLIELGPTAMIELTGLRAPCVLIGRFQAGLKRRVLFVDGNGRSIQMWGSWAWCGPADRSRPATPRGFGSRHLR